MNPTLKAATLALATYRLTQLITEDDIASPLREKALDFLERESQLPPQVRSKLKTLITCPFCVSQHAAFALLFIDKVAPRPSSPIIRSLALSAVTCLLYKARAAAEAE